MKAKTVKPAVNWFVERTSMHGVPSLAKSRSTKSRLFWGCVCFIGMGMFVFMLISLIVKYFSYPTTLEIDEVSKGFVAPTISFCNMRYAPLLVEIAVAKIATEKIDRSNFTSLDVDRDFIDVVSEYYDFLLKAYLIRENIEYPVSSRTTEQNETLKEWLEIKNVFTERWFLTTMLLKQSIAHPLEKGHFVKLESNIKENIVYCGNRNKECNENYITNFLSFNSINCFSYDPSEGHKMRESDSQGLANGVTFVFMTGNKLMANEFKLEGNGSWSIPGYKNTFEPSVGSEGMSLMIHDPEMSPYPDSESIDIAPGTSTTIGLTSREYTRLPHPHGDCSHTNIEADLIIQSVTEKLGYSPTKGSGMIRSRYRPGICRNTCLLRHIWEECGCLLSSEGLPFVNASLLCGRVNISQFSEAETGGENSCFNLTNLFKKECVDFLNPLYSDFICVQRVLKLQDHQAEEKKERVFKCNCPTACHTREYDATVGTSHWPSPGPEQDVAYHKIVREIIVPHLSNYTEDLTGTAVGYFNNTSNQEEIMKSFARVTVYVKSLKVDKIAQIASYSLIDLISDIGGQLGLWVGISAITVCEIFGFFSLAIQNLWFLIRGDDVEKKDANLTDESNEQML